MKEYTTSEMIQIIINNPILEFENIPQTLNVRWNNEAQILECNGLKFTIVPVTIEAKWVIKHKKVDFMTAFNAWRNNYKSIGCIKNGITTYYDNLIDKDKGYFMAIDIAQAEWFIDNGDI